eukprot:7315290-Pyramimonas_sp.AAC.1
MDVASEQRPRSSARSGCDDDRLCKQLVDLPVGERRTEPAQPRHGGNSPLSPQNLTASNTA